MVDRLLSPALIRLDGEDLYVMEVQPAEHAFGIPKGAVYRRAGRVRRMKFVDEGFEVPPRWEATTLAGERMVGATKPHVIRELLLQLGFYPIGANDTIPRLF